MGGSQSRGLRGGSKGKADVLSADASSQVLGKMWEGGPLSLGEVLLLSTPSWLSSELPLETFHTGAT